MMLVSYRPSDANTPWRAGIMCDQAVVDVSAYVSNDGRLYSSVQELLPLLDELCVWASQQLDSQFAYDLRAWRHSRNGNALWCGFQAHASSLPTEWRRGRGRD